MQGQSTIKAIETVYPWPDGPRYRSRLEARWAVFFDALGIKYEYEKEGYQTSSGGYLPDFWLPDHACWVEIKGTLPTKDELDKLSALASMTRYSAFLFPGLPSWESPGFGSYAGDAPVNGIFLSQCDTCRSLAFRCHPNPDWFECRFGAFNHFMAMDPRPYLDPASVAARQARFEHGEHGR